MKPKFLKKLLFFAVVLFGAYAFCHMPAYAEEAEVTVVKNGNCGATGNGSNVTWRLYSDGTLEISGIGATSDSSTTEWTTADPSVTRVVVTEGVTSIAAMMFSGLSRLTTVQLPSSVTSVEPYAFEYTALSYLSLAASSPVEFDNHAFSNSFSNSGLFVDVSAPSVLFGFSCFEDCHDVTCLVDAHDCSFDGNCGAFTLFSSCPVDVDPYSVTLFRCHVDVTSSGRKCVTLCSGPSDAVFSCDAFEPYFYLLDGPGASFVTHSLTTSLANDCVACAVDGCEFGLRTLGTFDNSELTLHASTAVLNPTFESEGLISGPVTAGSVQIGTLTASLPALGSPSGLLTSFTPPTYDNSGSLTMDISVGDTKLGSATAPLSAVGTRVLSRALTS